MREMVDFGSPVIYVEGTELRCGDRVRLTAAGRVTSVRDRGTRLTTIRLDELLEANGIVPCVPPRPDRGRGPYPPGAGVREAITLSYLGVRIEGTELSCGDRVRLTAAGHVTSVRDYEAPVEGREGTRLTMIKLDELLEAEGITLHVPPRLGGLVVALVLPVVIVAMMIAYLILGGA